MKNFTYAITTVVHFGKGQIEKLGAEVASRSSRVLMVYGGGSIKRNGVYDGAEVEVRDKRGKSEVVKVRGLVPYGHKIAVRDIAQGELIIKYGEEIGIATRDIRKGDYVHVHNLDSMRGRGDWKEEGK